MNVYRASHTISFFIVYFEKNSYPYCNDKNESKNVRAIYT